LTEERDSDLDALELEALRPSINPIQNLLATELATATLSADELQKIRHICEAALMVEEPEVAGVKLEEVRKILSLCEAFLNKVSLPTGDLMVPWPFTHAQAMEYFAGFCSDFALWDLEGVDYEKLRARDPEAIRSYFAALHDHTGLYPCHPATVFQLQQYFTKWALPICVRIMKAIFEKYVSPQTWEKTIAAMKGRTTHAGREAESVSD
jgi:hypothetical protein